MKTDIYILDSEKEYLLRLSGRWSREDLPGISIHAFTDPESFPAPKNTTRSIFLVAEKDYTAAMAKRAESSPSTILILDEETGNPFCEGIPRISKYLPAREILNRIFMSVPELHKTAESPQTGYRTKCISVFNTGLSGRDSLFAFGLASSLARKGSALYIDLTPFPPVPKLDEGAAPHDLSDVIYLIEKQPEELGGKIGSFITASGRLGMIASPREVRDLSQISSEGILKLLSSVDGAGTYDYTVISLCPCIDDLPEIFRACRKVLIPSEQSPLHSATLEKALDYLRRSGEDPDGDKYRIIPLPENFNINKPVSGPQDINFTEAGEFCRLIAQKEDL